MKFYSGLLLFLRWKLDSGSVVWMLRVRAIGFRVQTGLGIEGTISAGHSVPQLIWGGGGP